MKITQKQIDAIICLPGAKRYDHFVKVVADQRRAWGLYSEGWALAGASGEKPVFPVWPAQEYAALCATGAWGNFKPREIDLNDLLERLLPQFRQDGVVLGIFVTPNDKGVTPALDLFEQDLRNELSKIE